VYAPGAPEADLPDMTVMHDVSANVPHARSFHIAPLRYRDVLGATLLVGGATWTCVALAVRALLT